MTQENSDALLVPPRSDVGGPEEQAAQWLAYLYSGMDTEQGRREFSVWLQRSQENAGAYTALQQTWKDMTVPGAEGAFTEGAYVSAPANDLSSVDKDDETGMSDIVPSSVPERRLFLGIGALAASLLLFVGLWFAQDYTAVKTEQFATGIGEIRNVTLADGTVVTLSAGSRMHARLSSRKREVELYGGGAYFDVRHDQTRPFTVNTDATQVRVLGTAFEIRRGVRDVRVFVAEGVVAVGSDPNNERRLIKGQTLSASLAGKLGEVSTFETDQIAAWRDGKLTYRNARLVDVVAEVNRYRAVKIRLMDPALNEVPVTIALRVDATDHLLSGLEAGAGLRVVRHSTQVRVFPMDKTF